MAYCIDCRTWIAGLTLLVLDAGEALEAIGTLDPTGSGSPQVTTIDGVAVSLFELCLLATPSPILVAS